MNDQTREQRWTPTPRSQAETAYELLTDIMQVILEEPKRYNQGTWLEDYRLEDRTQREILALNTPSCGTVACVAGWAITLKYKDISGVRSQWATAELARFLLGLSYDQATELFDGDIIRGFVPGTLEYAQAGVRIIRAFRKKHEKQLKAYKIVKATDKRIEHVLFGWGEGI